jgi:hypothetical protein|tara:strand:+ start:557 stop:772 length:216 start_codon:yes stop_codon:yes gene_type:complete
MTRYKLLIDGTKVAFTTAEETQRDKDEAQAVIDNQTRIDTVIAKKANKASGKQKLKDLGLNDDEIKSLMGV